MRIYWTESQSRLVAEKASTLFNCNGSHTLMVPAGDLYAAIQISQEVLPLERRKEKIGINSCPEVLRILKEEHNLIPWRKQHQEKIPKPASMGPQTSTTDQPPQQDLQTTSPQIQEQVFKGLETMFKSWIHEELVKVLMEDFGLRKVQVSQEQETKKEPASTVPKPLLKKIIVIGGKNNQNNDLEQTFKGKANLRFWTKDMGFKQLESMLVNGHYDHVVGMVDFISHPVDNLISSKIDNKRKFIKTGGTVSAMKGVINQLVTA